MAIQWISGDTFTCLSADTKPTLVPADTKAIETNTDDVYRFNGTSWVLFSANDKTETLTNKTISGASNTVSNIPVNSISTFAVSAPITNQIMHTTVQVGSMPQVQAVALVADSRQVGL